MHSFLPLHSLVYLKEAITCLKANRLRSFLALLGLMIGTASVVALVTIGFLAKQAAIDQFKNLGTQKILLHVNSEYKDDFKTLNNLIVTQSLQPSSTEINQIFNANLISATYPITTMFKSVYFNCNKINGYQIGIDTALQTSLKLKLQSGRLLHTADFQQQYVLIGDAIRQKLSEEYHTQININDHIAIDNYDFIVIGILEHWPVDPLFTYDINHSILMPISTLQYLTNNYSLNEMYFDINPSTTPIIAEKYLSNILKHLLPNAHLQFSNPEQILAQIEKQAQILTILLAAIGAISLFVGAIGVMNIMLVSIVERKSEIGLRMAIGATPREIKLQFLFEAICLASLGGLCGTIIGIAIPYVITVIAGWNFTLSLIPVMLGLLLSFGVGLTAGFYPANQASKMLPVECI